MTESRIEALENKLHGETRRHRFLLACAFTCACLSMPFIAAAFDPFTPLQDGDVISAAEMNSRFDSIATALDDQEVSYRGHSLTSNISVDTADVAELRFVNLTPGTTYKLTLTAEFSSNLVTSEPRGMALNVMHDGAKLTTVSARNHHNDLTTTSGFIGRDTSVVVFTATATTLTFDADHVVGDINLTGNSGPDNKTFALLEELSGADAPQWDP